MNRRFCAWCLAAALLLVCGTVRAAEDNSIATLLENAVIMAENSMIYLSGGQIQEYDAPPSFQNGEVTVDLQTAAGALGGSYSFDGERFSLHLAGCEASGSTGSDQVLVDGGTVSIRTPVQVKNGRVQVNILLFFWLDVEYYTSWDYRYVVIGGSCRSSYDSVLIRLFGVYASPSGTDEGGMGYPSAPVLSLTRAAELAQSSLFSQYGISPVVYLHGGVYRGQQYIAGDLHGTVIRPFGDGQVTFADTVQVPREAFVPAQDSRIGQSVKGRVYQADVSSLFASGALPYPIDIGSGAYSGKSYYILTEEDAPCTLARYPNGNTFAWATPVTVGGQSREAAFTFDGVDMEQRWKAAAERGELIAGGYWSYMYAFDQFYVKNIAGNQIQLLPRNDYMHDLTEGDKPFFVCNLLEELDSPGEWYLDIETLILYYYPMGDMSNVELAVDTGAAVWFCDAQNVTLKNVSVRGNRENGVLIEDSSHVTVLECDIRHAGKRGAEILDGTDNTLKSCDISFIGGNGVGIYGMDYKYSLEHQNNCMEDCEISNVLKTFRTASGAVCIEGTGNVVRNNLIHQCTQSGIRFTGNDHKIEKNEIHHVVLEALDAGAIYSGRSWVDLGTEIQYNYIHDLPQKPAQTPFSKDGYVDNQGIYIDDGQSGISVHHNLISRCSRGALLGGGHDLSFRNNVIVDCKMGYTFDQRMSFGQWAAAFTLPGGQVYEEMQARLQNAQTDTAVWYEKYPGLKILCDGMSRHVTYSSDGTFQKQYNSYRQYDMGRPWRSYAGNNAMVYVLLWHDSRDKVQDTEAVQHEGDYETYSKTAAGVQESQNGLHYAFKAGSPAVEKAGELPIDSMGFLNKSGRGDLNARPMYPKNGAVIGTEDTCLVWAPARSADEYRIRVSRNADMSDPLIDQTADWYGRDTQFVLPGGETGDFYWQVEAISLSACMDQSQTSPVFHFRRKEQIQILPPEVADVWGEASDLSQLQGDTALISTQLASGYSEAVSGEIWVHLKAEDLLLSLSAKPVTLEAEETKKVTVSLAVPKELPQNTVLEVYFWDSQKGLKPLAQPVHD